MRYSTQGNQIHMSFPMFRNKLLTLFAVIFAGGFGFATFSIAASASEGGLFGIAAGLFGLPFALVALLSAVATIYLLFNNLQVTIDSGRVSIMRRLLFIPVFLRNLERHQISHLFLKKSGSTGQGVARVEHYKIKLKIKMDAQPPSRKIWMVKMSRSILENILPSVLVLNVAWLNRLCNQNQRCAG